MKTTDEYQKSHIYLLNTLHSIRCYINKNSHYPTTIINPHSSPPESNKIKIQNHRKNQLHNGHRKQQNHKQTSCQTQYKTPKKQKEQQQMNNTEKESNIPKNVKNVQETNNTKTMRP